MYTQRAPWEHFNILSYFKVWKERIHLEIENSLIFYLFIDESNYGRLNFCWSEHVKTLVLLKDQSLQKDYNKKCQSITIATPSKIWAMFKENDHLPERQTEIEKGEAMLNI